jgi:hypothetical protein
MSMYLSNADLRPTGAEIVEFIDCTPTLEAVLAEVPSPISETEERLGRE